MLLFVGENDTNQLGLGLFIRVGRDVIDGPLKSFLTRRSLHEYLLTYLHRFPLLKRNEEVGPYLRQVRYDIDPLILGHKLTYDEVPVNH